MDPTKRQDLQLLSDVGIALNKNGDIHDNLGNPARRRGFLGSEGQKRSRIMFTDEDDDCLSKWVKKAQDQGLRINIKIFEDLESINPRHTALSWQAHWKKLRDDRNQPSNTSALHLRATSPQSLASPYITESSAKSRDTQHSQVGAGQGVLQPSNLQIDGSNQRHVPYQAVTASPPKTVDLVQYPPNFLPPGIRGGGGMDETSLLLETNSSNNSRLLPETTFSRPRPTTDAANWDLPEMPIYPVVESRVIPGQIKGKEWISVEGKLRFEAQEAQLLSKWGVTPSHAGTCILVPRVWSGLDPEVIINSFDFDYFSRLDADRLSFSMLDHSTTWVRAATWFKSSPHNGMELDNFLGSGPFRPMDGSHLCHHGHCLNPFHSIYEDYKTNNDRSRCRIMAEELRALGLPIPKCCIRHKQRPCLLQHAAITDFEAYLIQISIAAQARGLEYTPPVSPPASHPYSTFETHLPISFTGCAVTIDPEHLATPLLQPVLSEPRPTFQCRHCSVANTFRSLPGFWAHIRDGHPLVPESSRIDDIVRSGTSWQSFKERNHIKGTEIDVDDTTWRQVEQMKQADFDWNVVRGWKLVYNRKRKFGMDDGSQLDY